MDESASPDLEGARDGAALMLDRRVRADRDWWLARLPRRRPASGFPLDLPRPAVLDAELGTIDVVLGEALAARLAELTRGSDFLLYAALAGGVAVLLHRLTGVGSVSIGSPPRRADEASAAPNALPLVVQLNESLRFRDVLLRVRGALLEAYEHQACPVTRLLRELGRDVRNRNPLFEVAVSLAQIHGPLAALPSDARLDLGREAGRVRGVLRYQRCLFRADMMRWRVRQLSVLLEAALAEPDRLVGSLPLEAEAPAAPPRSAPAPRAAAPFLDAAVGAAAAGAPEAPALVADGTVTTYGTLAAQAAAVAAALRRLGVVPGERVAVFVEGEQALVAAILGVLRSGAVYVPIHPAYHREGITEIVGDAGARYAVTEERLRARLDGLGLEVLALDPVLRGGPVEAGREEPLPARAAAACLLYARDQHGRLSRAEFSHAVLLAQLSARQGLAPLARDDRVLHLTPYPFYPAVWELFGPLAVGASIALAAADARRGGAPLVAALRAQEVTAVQLTPSLLRTIVAEPGLEDCRRLRLVYTTGEPLPAHLVRGLTGRTRATLINVYGACGVLGDVAACAANGLDDAGTVPLGGVVTERPFAVIDAQLRPAPVGTPGRLHVAVEPDGGGRRSAAAGAPGMLRTDDVVRARPDGTLEYVGRAGQVGEARGEGVDPACVEAVLAAEPSVRQAVVLHREDPETHRPALMAYVVPAPGGRIAPEALREAVAARYDAAYVPHLVLSVPSLPLRLSGKLDPGALPTREDEPGRRVTPYVVPGTPTEAAVAARWEAVLGFSPIGRADDFFGLRGSSLQAIEIISLLSEHFEIDLPMDVLFQAPTVAKMAAVIDESPRRHAASGDAR